jgi:hypothetical protein
MLGATLRITPDVFEQYLKYVRDAGTELLRAASTI